MKKILILGILLATFSSCSNDFIEEENLSNATAESFYVTPDGFNSLVNANYSQLRNIYGDDPFIFIGGTDLYSKGRGRGPLGLTEYTELNSTSSQVNNLYREAYESIQLANRAVYFSEITEQTPELPSLVGQVKFIRALSYFLLVQTYGGVPITDFVDSPVLSYGRNSAEEVYAQIISDLNDAVASVGNGAYDGRVNVRAAKNLLAKVYLTRGYESFGTASDFNTAATLADEVIAGESLTIPFKDLWDPANNDENDEVIFSIKFSSGSISADNNGLGSRQYAYFGSYLGGTEVEGFAPSRDYSSSPTNFALGLFTENDTRWDATFMTEVFSNTHDDVLRISYFSYYRVPEVDHPTLPVSDFYEPSWFTAADRADYLANNIQAPDFIYHEWGNYSSEWTDTATLDYEVICVKKFDDPDPTTAFGGRSSTRDIVLARLGETYLVAAEAHLMAGAPGTGLLRLNEVRNRAGVAPALIGEFDIDYILDERARELFGEYHRWYDLKRTGKLVERASMYNNQIETSNFVGAGGNLKILRPIPQDAIDLNQSDSFTQNPAYN